MDCERIPATWKSTITGLSAQLMSPEKKVKWKLWWKKKKAKRNAKTLKPLLASISQATLDDGPQISSSLVTYGATNRLILSQKQRPRHRELWCQSALCPKIFASCFTWETRDGEWQRHCSEFTQRIINLSSVLIALMIVSVTNRPTIVSTCYDSVSQCVLENNGLKSVRKTNAQAKHGFAWIQ